MAALRLAFVAAMPCLLPACTDDDAATAPGADGGAGGMPSTTTMVTTSSTGSQMLPSSFTVEGIVVDDDGAPIADATILQGGKSHEPTLSTGEDGSFQIELGYPGYGTPGVVATKVGYRTNGAEFFFEPPDEPITITLHEILSPDNPNYVYGDPGTGVGDPTTRYCGHCHETFAQKFQTSKHARAADDPFVQDLYAGVGSGFGDAGSCAAAGGLWQTGLMPGTTMSTNKCYIGGGTLPDLNPGCGGGLACDDPAVPSANGPTAFGQCADCHAPGINGVAGGRDLHEAVGVAFDHGVSCDVCHKVKDVDLGQPAGIGTRLILQRPIERYDSPTAEFRPLVFGPLLDVPNQIMGAAVQPKFKEAEFCAGCHQHEQDALVPGDSLDPLRWPEGLPVHTTYSEWLDGPYAAAGVPCQFCHMPAGFGENNTIALSTPENASITFGYPRPPEDVRQHIFRSPLEGTPRLIDGAIYPSIVLALDDNELTATVSVTNVGCGHAVPTGEPLRALVMLVNADGVGCGALEPTGGMTVFDAGGALARGIAGADVALAGPVLTWGAGAAIAQPGMIVRAVRPTGAFDDYAGVGLFATLPAAEKGLEIEDPVARATVVSATSGTITLDAVIAVQAGDIVYLGDAVSPIDGGASRAYAGEPGYAFAKVLLDGAGIRQSPHYRAVDVASDNRIPPGENALTTHRFDATGCTAASVHVTILYRPLPLGEARLRGWGAKDYVIATAEESMPIP
jgi:hypothetical protein